MRVDKVCRGFLFGFLALVGVARAEVITVKSAGSGTCVMMWFEEDGKVNFSLESRVDQRPVQYMRIFDKDVFEGIFVKGDLLKSTEKTVLSEAPSDTVTVGSGQLDFFQALLTEDETKIISGQMIFGADNALASIRMDYRFFNHDVPSDAVVGQVECGPF